MQRIPSSGEAAPADRWGCLGRGLNTRRAASQTLGMCRGELGGLDTAGCAKAPHRVFEMRVDCVRRYLQPVSYLLRRQVVQHQRKALALRIGERSDSVHYGDISDGARLVVV